MDATRSAEPASGTRTLLGHQAEATDLLRLIDARLEGLRVNLGAQPERPETLNTLAQRQAETIRTIEPLDAQIRKQQHAITGMSQNLAGPDGGLRPIDQLMAEASRYNAADGIEKQIHELRQEVADGIGNIRAALEKLSPKPKSWRCARTGRQVQPEHNETTPATRSLAE